MLSDITGTTGLASKNAILIVEFANQLKEKGLNATEAVREAAAIRLRPILMTSLAFVFGILPLVFATGAGAASRHSLGTAVCGGMVVSTALSLYIVPVIYVTVDYFTSLFRKKLIVTETTVEGNGASHLHDTIQVADETNPSTKEQEKRL